MVNKEQISDKIEKSIIKHTIGNIIRENIIIDDGVHEDLMEKCGNGMNRSTSIDSGKSPKQNLNYNQTTLNYLSNHRDNLTEKLNNLRKEKEKLDEDYLKDIKPLSEQYEKDTKELINDFKERVESFIEKYPQYDVTNQIKEMNDNVIDWNNMLDYDDTGRCTGLNDDEYFDNLADGSAGLTGLLITLSNNIFDDEVDSGLADADFGSNEVSQLQRDIRDYYYYRFGSKDMIVRGNKYYEDTGKVDAKIDTVSNDLAQCNEKISVVEGNIKDLTIALAE